MSSLMSREIETVNQNQTNAGQPVTVTVWSGTPITPVTSRMRELRSVAVANAGNTKPLQ